LELQLIGQSGTHHETLASLIHVHARGNRSGNRTVAALLQGVHPCDLNRRSLCRTVDDAQDFQAAQCGCTGYIGQRIFNRPYILYQVAYLGIRIVAPTSNQDMAALEPDGRIQPLHGESGHVRGQAQKTEYSGSHR